METDIIRRQECSLLQRPEFMCLHGLWEKEAGACYHSLYLMVNTAEIRIIHMDSISGSSFVGTGAVVTHINAGDDVYVRTHVSWNDCHRVSDKAGRSSFAGWKLS